MNLPKLDSRHAAELSRIQSSIPRSWQGNLMTEKLGFEAVREVMTRAVDDPEVPDAMKAKARTLLDSGFLDKTETVVEPVASELVDAYIAKEMLKSSIAKRLPKMPNAPKFADAMARFRNAKDAYDARYKEEA